MDADSRALHRERLRNALTAARSDLAKRGDEISLRASRYATQDPELQYHAGVNAWRTQHGAEARSRLNAALATDPQFHLYYADDARRILAAL